MSPSGAVGLVQGLTGLQSAQAFVRAQAGLQRGALDLQQQVIEQLLAQLLQQVGIATQLNLIA